MKHFLVIALFATALPALAASSIDWFTLDAGGGAQFSANYLVNFTAGQNDVSGLAQSSARYRITPGFWAVEDLGPDPGRPELTIALSGSKVILSWPSPSTGFLLQEADSIDALPGAWSDTPGAVSDNGIIKDITIPHDAIKRFYRLRKP